MSKKDRPWLCKCGFLLGIVSPDSNTLRIKYKDLYLSVEGADVKVTQLCRRCATPNTLSSSEELSEDIPTENKEKDLETVEKPEDVKPKEEEKNITT